MMAWVSKSSHLAALLLKLTASSCERSLGVHPILTEEAEVVETSVLPREPHKLNKNACLTPHSRVELVGGARGNCRGTKPL